MNKAKRTLFVLLCLLWIPYFMGAWNKDKPSSSTSLRNSNPEILANQSALETAIGNEHTFAAGTPDGAHTQGSARCFSQATAPTTQIDGGAFVSADLGSLWVDTDDNALYILTATTPTWTPVSEEVIATLLAAARIFADIVTFSVSPVFTEGIVANDAYLVGRNAADDGNVDLIKVGTNDLPTLPDSAEMASSAAPVEDEAVSNKKYVDDTVGALVLPSGLTGADDSQGETSIGVLELKWGKKTVAGATSTTVDFTNESLTDFSNACFKVIVSLNNNSATTGPPASSSPTTSGFTIRNNSSAQRDIDWFAVGR